MPLSTITFMLITVSVLIPATIIQRHLWSRRMMRSSSALQMAKRGSLDIARTLKTPEAISTENGEHEDSEFWETHASLIQDAWHEFDQSVAAMKLPLLNASNMIEPTLYQAVQDTWKSPSAENEARLTKLFDEIVPGVYRCQFLQPQRIALLREHLQAARESGIPLRRPNGMNRYGLIIDDKADGGVQAKALMELRQVLVSQYIRPLCRMLFSDFAGSQEDDQEAYAFTIRYKADEDLQLKEHSDASLYTMNLNLNLPEEDYQGSSLYFLDDDGNQHYVRWEPGMALLHRGMTRHASLPIESGERTNMVLWLFGKHGYVRIAPYSLQERLDTTERWAQPRFEVS